MPLSLGLTMVVTFSRVAQLALQQPHLALERHHLGRLGRKLALEVVRERHAERIVKVVRLLAQLGVLRLCLGKPLLEMRAQRLDLVHLRDLEVLHLVLALRLLFHKQLAKPSVHRQVGVHQQRVDALAEPGPEPFVDCLLPHAPPLTKRPGLGITMSRNCCGALSEKFALLAHLGQRPVELGFNGILLGKLLLQHQLELRPSLLRTQLFLTQLANEMIGLHQLRARRREKIVLA